MPLDYTKAPDAGAIATGSVNRADVVSAVERYLASKGIAVAASASSCGCSTPVKQSVVSNVAAEVVDQFLAKRGAPKGSGGYS
jgi:hypothetical protein